VNGIKTYSESVLEEEITALHFPQCENKNSIEMQVTSIADDQALRE
jgi:hypothetical protein